MESMENDDLKFNNELEKLKQQAEFGAKFFEGNSKIPPELEAEWLKHVRSFEESYPDAPQKTVGEIIGNPVFTPVSQVDPSQIDEELDKIFEILGGHNIALDYDDDVASSEIYRFITEELVNHEMDFMDMPEMITHFIYEEFHPNHEKDIVRHCESFCHQLFEKRDEYLDMELDHEMVFGNGTVMNKKQFVEKAKLWFDAYESFTVNNIGFMKPEFNLEQQLGHVHTWLDYDAKLENGSSINFSGPGIFYMHLMYGEYWGICGMDFPGFKEWAF